MSVIPSRVTDLYYRKNPNPFDLVTVDNVPEDKLVEVAPVMNYVLDAVDFLVKTKHTTREHATDIIIDLVNKEMEDPEIKYFYRDEFGDKWENTTTLTKYIKDAYKLNQTLAPSLTRYSPPASDGGVDSLHKKMTSKNLKKRSITKENAAIAYSEGRFWEASELTNLQKVIKLLNNAFSGAFASPSTIHYNPSAHYALTSITRSTSSIGNAMSEMMIAGNRIYLDLDSTLSHLITTVTQIYDSRFIEMLDKFKIHIPTVDEVCDMVSYSTDLYWKSEKHSQIIRDYVEGCNDLERCKMMYANDLYHFHMYNKELSTQMIMDLARKDDGNIGDDDFKVEMCTGQPDYINNLAYHICSDEIKGIKFKPEKYRGTAILDVMAGTTLSIHQTLENYKLIFKALFSHRVLPTNIAYTKEMLRRVIVLSDTDSTCATYGWWVQDILQRMDYGYVGIGVSSAVMTIVSLATTTAINVFTDNMNVGSDSKGLLEMKNEYFWKTFAIGSGTKHYYASVYVKEGMVYKEPKLELKGSQFILSKVPLEFREISDKMFEDINRDVTERNEVDIRKYINTVLAVEMDITKRMLGGDFTILESTEIKDSSAYKIPSSSPYNHYNIWREVFEEEYGVTNKPPYLAIKYSLKLPSKGKINLYLESLEDSPVKDKLVKFFTRTNRTQFNTILLPFAIVEEKGVPKELEGIVNIDKTIVGICKSMYLTMKTLGFHMPKGATLTSMGYTLE